MSALEPIGGRTMRLHFLGKGESEGGGCPSLYTTDHDSYVVQGWATDTLGTVEVPQRLLGFVQPETYIDSVMIDTGRGTFALSGMPVTDAETLAQMDIYPNEAAIEVAKAERTFYGHAASAG
ncbi:hypothetical protein [Nocardia tengchongensis]|uniref:hypothetical protein n=1 Tax=Nocardia tengchongensis TaxID=2055889 RepID=UPI0036532E44